MNDIYRKSKVIGTMVVCLSCQDAVWADDHDHGDIRGTLNMLRIPCRVCKYSGEKWQGYDGYNVTFGMADAIAENIGVTPWHTFDVMIAIAKTDGYGWNISPDNTWR
jgi:hypothetical protein